MGANQRLWFWCYLRFLCLQTVDQWLPRGNEGAAGIDHKLERNINAFACQAELSYMTSDYRPRAGSL